MIASRAGLVVLAAIAAVLAIMLAFLPRADTIENHTLVQDIPAGPLRWMRGGVVETTIAFGEEGQPLLQGGDLDEGTLDAVDAALRGARWHRRADASVAGTPHVVLSIGAHFELAIGESLPGVDQTWIVTRGQAYLVDGWVARALDPGALALRERFPYAKIASAGTIAVGELHLEAHPRRRDGMIVDVARVEALERAMEDLEYVALGPCDSHSFHVHAQIGDGCVPLDRWQAILAQANALAGPPADVVERRPLVTAPSRIALSDGAVLDLARRPRLAGRDADPDRVAELVAALTAPAEPVSLPATRPTGAIVAGDLAIDLYDHDHVLARRGEPIALKPSPEAWAAIARPSSAYADPQRWLEDASTITSITIDGAKHERGAVLGEWTMSRGAHDPAVLEALAAALASVRAPIGPAPAAIEHRIDVAFAPPTGKPVTHRLELGHLGPTGCAGRADGVAVALPAPLCVVVAAAAATAPR